MPNGDTVTRAQAENINARSEGFTSNYDRRQSYAAFKATPSYQETRDAAKERGTSVRDFHTLGARVQSEYRHNDNKYDRMDKSPNGALAQYLVSIGRRSETADYAVGDSPK
jgi:hypothetical protein